MSELKAIRSGEIYNIIEYEDCYRTDDLYYPKSDADKVIADLEQKLAAAQQVLRLNEPKALYSNLETMGRLKHEIDVVARRERHHKYKRCLAMAQVLEHVCPMTNRKAKWRDKWHKRWLKIAEQFKPNNQTAQYGKGKNHGNDRNKARPSHDQVHQGS